MATQTTETAEGRAAERSGEAAGRGTGQAISDAASAVTGAASSGYNSVSGWFSKVMESFKTKGFWGGLQDMFGGMWEQVTGFFGSSGDPEKDKKGLNVGSLLGMLGFGIGGWMLGGMFGGGYIGMFFGVGLALAGAALGSQFGDQTINKWLGRSPQRSYAPATGAPVQHVGVDAVQQDVAQAPNAAGGITEPQALAATQLPYDGQMYQDYRAQLRDQYAPQGAMQVTDTRFAYAAVPGAASYASPAATPAGQPIGYRFIGNDLPPR